MRRKRRRKLGKRSFKRSKKSARRINRYRTARGGIRL